MKNDEEELSTTALKPRDAAGMYHVSLVLLAESSCEKVWHGASKMGGRHVRWARVLFVF